MLSIGIQLPRRANHLWIDKQSYLVRRIDERIKLDRIKLDGIRIERTTTYDPTIDDKITDEMLEFDPPSPQAADDGANTLSESDLGSNESPTRTAQERDADMLTPIKLVSSGQTIN